MTPLTSSPALHGPQLLVVADVAVDIDMLRKLRFTQITIARMRPDGTFDHRIGFEFDFAIASITHLDGATARSVADFVLPRLIPGAALQFFRPAKSRTADLALIRATQTHLTVTVAPMPEPFNRQAIEVRPAPTRAKKWRLRRKYTDQGSERLPNDRHL